MVPSAIAGAEGVTAIETSVAAVTVRAVEPLTEPEVAEMVAEPCVRPVARPMVGLALLIVATAGVLDDHVTVVVRFCVVPSV